MQDLVGKVAFVTGAASGIGLGIAEALAQAGVKVMMADIEQDALDREVARLAATNADVAGVRADVSLKAELQRAADATIERFGKVHILVNNAGVGGGGTYGEWSDASWDWVIGVNLMSVVWGIEIFGPLMEKHGEGGQIVSTASMAGLVAAVAPGIANPFLNHTYVRPPPLAATRKVTGCPTATCCSTGWIEIAGKAAALAGTARRMRLLPESAM